MEQRSDQTEQIACGDVRSPGMTRTGCDGTSGVEAERSETQGHLQLHTKFQVSLDYMRPHCHTAHSSSWPSEGSFATDCQC